MPLPKVISVQSFRQGTGTTTLAANLATALARKGYRVGLVDSDFYSPSVYLLLGMADEITYTFNDYLWGICEIGQAVYTPAAAPDLVRENLFVLPASGRPPDIMRMLRDTYHTNLLDGACRSFLQTFDLDTLVIDAHAGLSDEALLFMALAEQLLIMLRPDSQHYSGTSTMLHLARKLDVPRTMLVLNEVPASLDKQLIVQELRQAYDHHGLIAVLPYSTETAELGGERIISWDNAQDPLSLCYVDLANSIVQA